MESYQHIGNDYTSQASCLRMMLSLGADSMPSKCRGSGKMTIVTSPVGSGPWDLQQCLLEASSVSAHGHTQQPLKGRVVRPRALCNLSLPQAAFWCLLHDNAAGAALILINSSLKKVTFPHCLPNGNRQIMYCVISTSLSI